MTTMAPPACGSGGPLTFLHDACVLLSFQPLLSTLLYDMIHSYIYASFCSRSPPSNQSFHKPWHACWTSVLNTSWGSDLMFLGDPHDSMKLDSAPVINSNYNMILTLVFKMKKQFFVHPFIDPSFLFLLTIIPSLQIENMVKMAVKVMSRRDHPSLQDP